MKSLLVVICLPVAVSLTSGQSLWQRSPSPVLPVWNQDTYNPTKQSLLFFPSVLHDSITGLYRIWYMYLPVGSSPYTIGHAISVDGMTWFPFAQNPVLRFGSSGSFDYPGLHDPFVIRDRAGYRMYYTGYNGTNYAIGVAMSSDGVKWAKYHANPVMTAQPNQWEAAGPAEPKVFFDGSGYKMFYTGVSASGVYGIGLATSSDGFTWTRHPGNPVLQPGPPGSWDQHAVGTIAAFRTNNVYYLFYGGGPYTPIGYATSTDGITWTKYSGNPVFSPGPPGTWDGQRVEHGSLVLQGNLLKFWYSGYGYNSTLGGSYWQIGYTISAFSHSASPAVTQMQSDYRLFDANPNPFNPETEIRYDVSVANHVTIKVYDVIGRDVATLVNEMKAPGSYVVRWTPDVNASGVYYYRMTAGEFSETKKMTLLR